MGDPSRIVQRRWGVPQTGRIAIASSDAGRIALPVPDLASRWVRPVWTAPGNKRSWVPAPTGRTRMRARGVSGTL